MKPIFDYIQKFPFKNVFAIFIVYELLDILRKDASLKDVLIVLLTLIIKHFYDSNSGSAAKDATISKALDQAQQLPAVTSPVATTESGNINVK